MNLLKHLLRKNTDMTKVLVFVASKRLADQLFDSLQDEYADTVGVIHSNKEQNHRFNTVKQFQEGNYRLIIATDIVARGLDIAEVTHVINFDLPTVPEDYIHRIGRTGRANRRGEAIALITPREEKELAAIETLMNYQLPLLTLPGEVEISSVLTEDEKPKVYMKTDHIKLPKREGAGAAFHEKSAKNSKVNRKVRHADLMKQKYGKPKKRGKK